MEKASEEEGSLIVRCPAEPYGDISDISRNRIERPAD